MAAENSRDAWVTIHKTSGLSIYYRMTMYNSGYVWNDITKGWAASVSRADSAIHITETNPGDYPLTIPSNLTGTGDVNIVAYEMQGSIPDESLDTVSYGGVFKLGSIFGF